MAQFLTAGFSALRKLFARERLPPPPSRPDPAPGRAPAAWRLLLLPERLDEAPEAPPAPRRRWIRLLLAPEPLARAPEAPPRRRGPGWLRLLLLPERLGAASEARGAIDDSAPNVNRR